MTDKVVCVRSMYYYGLPTQRSSDNSNTDAYYGTCARGRAGDMMGGHERTNERRKTVEAGPGWFVIIIGEPDDWFLGAVVR